MGQKDENHSSTTQLYQCRKCGRVIIARLPAGLTGEFAHFECESVDLALGGGDILDAEFLTLSHDFEN
jgi:hypothetical protein